MKPRVKFHSLLLLCRIDEYIRQYDVRGRNLACSASDVMDDAVFNHEITDLIRRKLLTVIRYGDYRGNSCGSSWTVHLTERAVRLFWPDRIAETNSIRIKRVEKEK